MDIIIRNEAKEEYFEVENLTREAFWNVYKPGCDEHLVLHNLRTQDSFIKELDLVAVFNHQIIGNIVYSRAYVETEEGRQIEVIIFGPVSILPAYQHLGVGKRLIETSMNLAKQMGFRAVLITGSPRYYAQYGFAPAFNFGIHYHDVPMDYKADFFMVKELIENGLKGVQGILYDSSAFFTETDELEKFDKLFPKKVKRITKRQLHI